MLWLAFWLVKVHGIVICFVVYRCYYVFHIWREKGWRWVSLCYLQRREHFRNSDSTVAICGCLVSFLVSPNLISWLLSTPPCVNSSLFCLNIHIFPVMYISLTNPFNLKSSLILLHWMPLNLMISISAFILKIRSINPTEMWKWGQVADSRRRWIYWGLSDSPVRGQSGGMAIW